MSTREAPEAPSNAPEGARISPHLVWFVVLAGTVAWAVHLFVAWGVTELACLGPADGTRLNQGGAPGPVAVTTVWVGTIVPWLVTASALLVGLRLRARLRRSQPDELARERTGFLLVIGLLLDALTLAAITGGGVALLVLEPCV